MSIEAMVWVLYEFKKGEQTRRAQGQKLVMMGIANHANPDGTAAFPSEERLAQYAAMDPRSVRRILAALIAEGYLIKHRRGKPHHHNRYDIVAMALPSNVSGEPTALPDNVTSDQPIPDSGSGMYTGPATQVHRTQSPVIPDPALGGPPTNRPITVLNRPLGKRDELFEAVCEACEYEFADLTKTERGRVNSAVKELRAVKAAAEDVRMFGALWPYDGAPVTPQAIAGNWSDFTRGKFNDVAMRRSRR